MKLNLMSSFSSPSNLLGPSVSRNPSSRNLSFRGLGAAPAPAQRRYSGAQQQQQQQQATPADVANAAVAALVDAVAEVTGMPKRELVNRTEGVLRDRDFEIDRSQIMSVIDRSSRLVRLMRADGPIASREHIEPIVRAFGYAPETPMSIRLLAVYVTHYDPNADVFTVLLHIQQMVEIGYLKDMGSLNLTLTPGLIYQPRDSKADIGRSLSGDDRVSPVSGYGGPTPASSSTRSTTSSRRSSRRDTEH